MKSPPKSTLLAYGLLEDPGAIPLVIGVVGHRDPIPEVLPFLERNLRLHLQQLIQELPSTALVMLNGLAEGIDVMAARVFAEVVSSDRSLRGERAPHHKLIAALPKTPIQFRSDFTNPNSLEELDQLLSRCDAVLHPGNCADLRVPSSTNGQTRQTSESACYGQQSLFLVQNSYLLMAFFDGVETHLEGGTSQSIAMHRGLIHPFLGSVEEILIKQETGVQVIHHTPRRSPDSPREGAGEISFWPDVHGTGVEIPATLLTIPRLIDEMNAAISAPSLRAADYGEGLHTRLWTFANQEAIANKKRYELLCRILVLLGFALVLLSQLLENSKALWWGLLLIAFLLFPRLQERPKQAFISHRCLSECLSVQYLWSSLGIYDSAADQFLSRSHEELGWIRTVVRSVRLQLLILSTQEELHRDQVLERARQWIIGQISYLNRAISILGSKAVRWQRTAVLLAVMAMIVAVLEILPKAPEGLGKWVEVLLAGFGSALAYRELMGYQDTKERYALSVEQFNRGRQALDDIRPTLSPRPLPTHARAQLVVEAIGREKLDELNHWVRDQLQRVYAPGT